MDMPLKDVAERMEEAERAAIVAVDTVVEVAGARWRCSPLMM